MEMNAHTKSNITFAALIGLILATSAVGAADEEVDARPLDYDMKIVPGAICVAGIASDTFVEKGGAIYNTSTSHSNDIICPIVWDRDSDTIDVVFNVNRPAGAGPMSCYVTTKDALGNISQVNKRVTGTGNNKWVHFYGIPSAFQYSTAAGCTLPKQTTSSHLNRSSVNWVISYQN